MSVTVKDVAKKAGVATSTVSRVINDHPSISEATKKKVRLIMDDLGYVPNIAARSLGKRAANAIGVILPPLDSKDKMGNPFYLEMIEAINAEARIFAVTISVATAQSFTSLLENVKLMHRQKQVDGFILLYADNNDPIIDYLYENKITFTLIGQPAKHETEIAYVDNDNQLLGKNATEYLIENGHQNILFITNTMNESLYFERFFGYQKALMLANLPVHEAVSLQEDEDYTLFSDHLKQTEATAAVVIDDIFSLRVIQLAKIVGYEVPRDFSIISFNNSIFATLTHPYLTSIDIDIQELGRKGLQKVMEQLSQADATGVRIVVPHQLIKRETVRKLNQ